MLKNIRLHLEKDEEKQKQLEASLAINILETHHKNVNSFARNIPTLLPLIKNPNLQNYSLFCNKYGDINIVDYGVGRTLYGFHPKQEISEQVDDFLQFAPYFSLDTTRKNLIEKNNQNSFPLCFETCLGYQQHMSQKTAPETLDCLVILGCGLGLHILELLQLRTIKNVIIYEPEIQYFQCSALINKWNEIFALAKSKGTKIFIQVEKDGRNLVNDINELNEHEAIEGFYLFKHYNHVVFNSILKDLRVKSWLELQENGINFNFSENFNHYVPVWTPTIRVNEYTSCMVSAPLFQKNLLALEKYFPTIFQEYKSYKPQTWLPVENSEGQINVVKADSLTPWYSDKPKQDCLFNYQNYHEQPHKDGLVLGYKGTKLAHYIHYKFVKETEDMLEKAEKEIGSLPQNIASIIMFGLGVGYQLKALLENHKVEKLFLCEPNTDFFYASLFAIDWQRIFETIDISKGRIYLNIGDDGTNLFRDLLGQFHSIGPYILNNTYFYQSYYNASLNIAIAQLREQLQIVISMGEYFDHAFFGIEHTKEGFRRNIPVLTKNPGNTLNYDDRDVPVFIVGNGPSLDLSIEAIKEWKDQAIIISCGTALQALHRHGITPDFHAEIEQNRNTFDWAVLIGDLNYLKNITLISCNGIHPDTCDLYKDVLIAFKEGESSTVSALSVFGQQHAEVLQHAFPTVSNFVTNLVSVLGFNHIYLMGVDLGFVDVKHHHSKSSGYYQDNGKEKYNYTELNNTSLVVAGNFRSKVNTKHEFKISKQIIEQVIHKKIKEQTFYNCSDGAKIIGTNPLNIDNIIIVSSSKQKCSVLEKIKTSVYSTEYNKNFIKKYETKYSHSLLVKEIGAIEKLLAQKVDTPEQIIHLINKQKELLFTSYQNGKSLLFYYLYGTMNYTNAVLTKLTTKSNDSEKHNKGCFEVKDKWLATLKCIKSIVANNSIANFDLSTYSGPQREAKMLEINDNNESLLIVVDSEKYKNLINYTMSTTFSWKKNFKILTIDQYNKSKENADYLIYYSETKDKKPFHKGKINTVLVTQNLAKTMKLKAGINYFIVPNVKQKIIIRNVLQIIGSAIHFCLSNHKNAVTFAKINAYEGAFTNEEVITLFLSDYILCDHLFYVYIDSKENFKNTISRTGARGKVLFDKLKYKHILYKLESKQEFDINLEEQMNLIKSLEPEG
jgi:hypothetical protein